MISRLLRIIGLFCKRALQKSPTPFILGPDMYFDIYIYTYRHVSIHIIIVKHALPQVNGPLHPCIPGPNTYMYMY